MLDQSFDQIVYLAEIEAQARSVTQEFGAQVVTVFSFDGAHFAAKLFFEFTAHVVCVELCDGLGDGLLADLFRAPVSYTHLNGNMTELRASIEGVVTSMPWLFGIALFVMSILLYSQAATVRALMPLGIALGISPWMLVALFPAVNGYFFIPNYPTVVAAINFDRTGTTRIGKYVLNHSFMMPGLIATIGAMLTGLLLIRCV